MTLTVSVVIPNYNYARTLDACLRSVYGQTYPPHEVIVVDDRSTDGSRDIAARFPCRTVVHPDNRGVSAARNTGAALATGDVLFFLDSDEALEPDAIANAVAILRDDPDVGCVHGVIAPEPLVDDGPVEWYRTLHAYWWRRRHAGPVRTAFFAQAAIRRSIFDEVGPFDEQLRDSEDLEYSDRLAPRTRIVLSERVVARHDEVARLGPLLAEQFRRSQLLARTVLAARREGRASLTANRPTGILAVAGALGMLPLALIHPAFALGSALLVAVFAVCDIGLLRFVAHHRGPRFLPFFLGVHLLLHIALVAGAVLGCVRLLLGHRPTRWLTPLVLVSAVVALGFTVRAAGTAPLVALSRPAGLPLLLAATAANLAGLLIGMVAWRVLVPVRGLPAARIFFLGQLGKYLPGRVWGVVTHVDLGRQAGAPAERMITAYLVSIGLTILAGAGVGLLAAPGPWILLPLVGFVALLVRPALLDRPVALVARLVRRPVTPLPPAAVRAALALALLSWLVSGLHLWALAVALGAPADRSAAVAIGAFALATVAGSLSIVAPDGWGVREFALAAALATVLPWGVAGTVALASRLICVVVEIGTSLAVLGLARFLHRGESHVHAVHP